MIVFVTGRMNPDAEAVVCSIAIAEFLNKRGIEAVPVVAGEAGAEVLALLTRFRLVCPEKIASVEGKDVVLVAHSASSGAPEGIAQARILGMVDREPIGDLSPQDIEQSPLYLMRRIGSTATLVKELFDRHDMEFSAGLAGALASVINSDMEAEFSAEDRQEAENLSKIAGI